MRIGATLLICGLLFGCGSDRDGQEREDLEFVRAQNALAQGREDWARVHFRRDFERHPERVESLRGEASAWMSGAQQSYSEAVNALRGVLERDPTDQESRRLLVRALLNLGDWDLAQSEARDLDDSEPSRLLLAESLRETDAEEAREVLERALDAGAESWSVHSLASEVFERLGDFERSAEEAQRAIRQNPLDYSSYYRLGRQARRRGDVEEATELLETHQLLARLVGDGTMSPPPPQDALSLLDRLAARGGVETFAVQRRRAELLLEAGRLAEAENLIRELGQNNEAGISDLLEMARDLGDAGRLASSRSLFEGVLGLDPHNRGAVSSLAFLDLDRGEVETARRRLDEAIQADPDFARYHYLRGRVAVTDGEELVALGSFGEAVNLAPWEAGWRVELVDLLRATGDEARAREILFEAPEASAILDDYRRRHVRWVGDATGGTG
ncbi:MAG: tetratricopeptide repeat protein [Thermoanaerobaculia bacterium]|nr:tetratricopeptide repeat protein [Thermoanaerobaculia bacterium]